MIEQILDVISKLTPFWLYIALFVFSYVENVFPPSPSDLVVVIGGSLIAVGEIHFIPTLLFTSLGSVFGFMTLYYIGSAIDKKVIRAGKFKFISREGLEKAESWFNKYGYWVIIANRFLPGTRSVISFFAGLSELQTKKTAMYALISALVWNAIIIYLGILFGNNLPLVDRYLSTYSNIAIALTAAIVLFLIVRFFWKRKKSEV